MGQLVQRQVLVRKAVAEDASAIIGIARSVLPSNLRAADKGFLRNHYTEEEYAKKVGGSPYCGLAENDGEAVGFLVAFPGGDAGAVQQRRKMG